MRRLETRLDGPILIELEVLGDERGFFCETYRRSAFGELGIAEEMVQDNHSRSRRGVVKGCAARSAAAPRSWSAARLGRFSTWSLTSAAGHRRSANGKRSS